MPQNAAYDQAQHCLFTGISMQNAVKVRNSPETPKARNGLNIRRMNKSTGQKKKVKVSSGLPYLRAYRGTNKRLSDLIVIVFEISKDS